jgi:hypothetical protein
MSARGEKRQLVVADSVDPRMLKEGSVVEAFDAETAKKFWPGKVIGIDSSAENPQDWKVEVKFKNCENEYVTVRVGDLRPEGWQDYQRVLPGQGRRSRPSTALSREADGDTRTDSGGDESEGEAPAQRRTRRVKRDDEIVVVSRIFDSRLVGDEREYLCQLDSGKLEWLKRSHLEETDARGSVTVTGALLAYEWAPAYVVQTYSNGQEFLVAWHGRTENDWARIPASCFTARDLQVMEANKPCASPRDTQRAIFHLFIGVQQCLRSPTERSRTLEFLPGVDVEAGLGDKGKPVTDGHEKPALAGDRVLLSFSREELNPLFRPYREKWDEVRSKRGKLLGRIDFSDGLGVHIIWYARPCTYEFYTAEEGYEMITPRKHPNPYIEVVKVRVFCAQSTEAEDKYAVAEDD